MIGCARSEHALTLGHLAVAVLAPNRAQICQCECGQSGQANLATRERCAATVRAATVQMLMSRHAHTHGYATSRIVHATTMDIIKATSLYY